MIVGLGQIEHTAAGHPHQGGGRSNFGQARRGLSARLRSRPAAATDVLVLDSIGELDAISYVGPSALAKLSARSVFSQLKPPSASGSRPKWPYAAVGP